MAEWTHVLARSPWPERTGLPCRLVPDLGDGIYPFDKRHTNAVILIKNDPLDDTAAERGWSCVVDPADLDEPERRYGTDSTDEFDTLAEATVQDNGTIHVEVVVLASAPVSVPSQEETQ